MGSQDPWNDRLPRSWIAARSLRSSPPISPILPPRLFPRVHTYAARVSNLRAACFYRHECQFMTSRHSATATTSSPSPSLSSPFRLSFHSLYSTVEWNTGENACPRFLGPPTRLNRDKISRISGGPLEIIRLGDKERFDERWISSA